MNPQKNNSGQLAVGLAFAFAGILAMFGLVFNSSLNTREKMKLQTTSDYAALVAANIQRYNLNNVRTLNNAIETSWLGLEYLLNTSKCNAVIAACGTSYPCVLGVVKAAVNKDLDPADSSVDCDSVCDSYDEKIYDDRVQEYETLQSSIAGDIVTSIEEGNSLAFDYALDTFLAPENLPLNLYTELESKLGKGFDVENVRSEYDKGALNTEEYAYSIIDENKDYALFMAEQEYRTTIKSNFYYQSQPCTTGTGICSCIAAPPIGSPKVITVPFRITRATDDTTYFYTGINYSPPPNLLEKMLTLGVKQPDSENEKFGQNVEAAEGDLLLFQRHTKGIQAVSAAKPYGGTFPKSGDISGGLSSLLSLIVNGVTSGFSVFGTSGDEFTGAKLFGIADKQEIGDIRIGLADGCLVQADENGNLESMACFKAEDFLH